MGTLNLQLGAVQTYDPFTKTFCGGYIMRF